MDIINLNQLPVPACPQTRRDCMMFAIPLSRISVFFRKISTLILKISEFIIMFLD